MTGILALCAATHMAELNPLSRDLSAEVHAAMNEATSLLLAKNSGDEGT